MGGGGGEIGVTICCIYNIYLCAVCALYNVHVIHVGVGWSTEKRKARGSALIGVLLCIDRGRDYWMIYRGPGFLAVVWLGSSPINLSLFLSSPVCRWSSLLTEEGERGWGRSKNHRTAKKQWSSVNCSIFSGWRSALATLSASVLLVEECSKLKGCAIPSVLVEAHQLRATDKIHLWRYCNCTQTYIWTFLVNYPWPCFFFIERNGVVPLSLWPKRQCWYGI